MKGALEAVANSDVERLPNAHARCSKNMQKPSYDDVIHRYFHFLLNVERCEDAGIAKDQ